MKKFYIILAMAFFSAVLMIAADQPPPNPFKKYEKDLEKLEDKKAKEKDDKKKKSIDADIKRLEEKKDKDLKKLSAPIETEKEKLTAEIDKAKEKDKGADVSVKQSRVDYLDKMLQYYTDLYAGKAAEMPKEPSKNAPANPANKDAAKEDAPANADPVKKAL